MPSLRKTPYRVVDLFSGCGGLTRGFERTGRFTTIFGVDIHKYSVETFLHNHGLGDQTPSVFEGDIQALSMDDLWKALREHDVRRAGELECLVGGPPCEGFSRNKVYTARKGKENPEITRDPRSKRVKKYAEAKYWQTAWQAKARESTFEPEKRSVQAYNPFLADPRNELYRSFLRIASELKPRIILIENVREMLTHNEGAIAREITGKLSKMGYAAEVRILNAAEYGVPQLRQRAFFVCVRKDLLDPLAGLPWPTKSHAPAPADLLKSAPLPGDQGIYVSTREAIADLPPSRPEPTHRGSTREPLSAYPKADLTAFRKWVRSGHLTPENHVHRTPSAGVIERLKAMKPGMRAHDLPPELQTKKYYYNAYARLEWEKPANTITKSFIFPGSGKFTHPEEHRVLSYREAARLQSFDDDFVFISSSQEGLSHMVGSAVPPLLGYRFALRFADVLDGKPQVPTARQRA